MTRIKQIYTEFKADIEDWLGGLEMTNGLYTVLYDYYSEKMPLKYLLEEADPLEYIETKFFNEFAHAYYEGITL